MDTKKENGKKEDRGILTGRYMEPYVASRTRLEIIFDLRLAGCLPLPPGEELPPRRGSDDSPGANTSKDKGKS